MTSPQPQLPWHDPAWQKQAQAWIQAEAKKNSIDITGEIEQPHMYPWSTILRVLSNAGTLFFKATALETVYESALTQKLAEWYPDCMPELIAVDIERGWMLDRHENFTFSFYGVSQLPPEQKFDKNGKLQSEKPRKPAESKADIFSRFDLKLLMPGTRLKSGAAVPAYD